MRKGEELKAPHYASAAATRDYIITRDIIPNTYYLNLIIALFRSFIFNTTLILYILLLALCYGPSVISVTVTTGGHPRGGGLYGTSGTMGRGVAESHS